MDSKTKALVCAMDSACDWPIKRIDDKGFVYCDFHGIGRKYYARCRKLRPHELKKLQAGGTLTRY